MLPIVQPCYCAKLARCLAEGYRDKRGSPVIVRGSACVVLSSNSRWISYLLKYSSSDVIFTNAERAEHRNTGRKTDGNSDLLVCVRICTRSALLTIYAFASGSGSTGRTRPLPPSIIEAKNKIRLDHDESCNCCCCCLPQHTSLKYVQPTVPKSYAPIRYYWKSDVPMDDDTTYRLSYWDCPSANVEPIAPRDWLTVGDGEISDETTYKGSYLGNWCIKPEVSITPCQKQWLGRGPIQDVTTQKHDYTWKCVNSVEPFRAQDNLFCPAAPLSDNTTYKLSYYESGCYLPSVSYGPRRSYSKPDVPMEGCTTYKLSYWPNESPVKEPQPWSVQKEYLPPLEPMDGCTTYRLSYWPCSEKRRSPIILPSTENVLNAGCCTDNNTTYRLSYFGCGGEKPDPIRQPDNIHPSPCPPAYDTTNRMSFLGNWCVKPEGPITPCNKQMLGRGPMQDVTTQKHDYTWKSIPTEADCRRSDNLVPSSSPMECCTTHRLSYLRNCKSLTPVPTYAPQRSFHTSNIPMESETIMQLSYQPIDSIDPGKHPWSEKPDYYCPTTPMEDNTTYNTRFTLVLFTLFLRCN